MSTIPPTRIRIQADLFRFEAFGDVLRADDDEYRPKFRAGDDIQFEIGFFNNGTLQDISGIASVTLEIKPIDEELIERFSEDDDADNYDLRGPDLSLTPIRVKTIAATDLNPALTEVNWNTSAAEHCHALITLNSAESNIASGDRWLTIAVTTNDVPGRTRTVCAGPIRVLGGGLSQSASPEASTPETFYNTQESDVRFLQISNNLSDLSDTSSARDNLGLGEDDQPAFAGLSLSGELDLNSHRLRELDDAVSDTDALNRRSADSRYSRQSFNLSDLSSPAAARDNLDIFSKSETLRLAARDFGPSLHLDGVSGYVAMGTAIPVGPGDWTAALRINLHATPTSAINLIGSSNGSSSYGPLGVIYEPAGSLWRTSAHGTGNSVSVGSYELIPGRWVAAVIRKQSGTTSLWIDGQKIDESADSLDYAPFDRLGVRNTVSTPAGLSPLYLASFDFYNLALPDALIIASYSAVPTQAAPIPAYRWGWPGPFSEGWSFSTGSGSVVSSSYESFTMSASGTWRLWQYPKNGFPVKAGSTVPLNFNASSISGTVILRLADAAGNALTGNYVVQAGANNHAISVNTSAERAFWTFASSTGQTGFSVTDFVIAPLPGAIISLSPAAHAQSGYQLHDRSYNHIDALISQNGCTWTTPADRLRLCLRSAIADAWLGGSQRLLIPAGFRIVNIIATETAGNAATNLALGTTANGADIVSGFSITAGETKNLSVTGAFAARANAQPIHINDSPAGSWSGASIDLTFILERI
ncbi:hypothetical protein H5P28_02115 [Ruficoccus amylovorans]|uniref:Uncharacterized protein n=1 Tax=Ruficoccus amylovorans TaxID=1804625 RepID=A0A842HBF6_9BACT|nr:LamG-like jellyroll fold domain-containing protein [Ruficoccus amylovorans]MBC2593046.1 hypothetical protein [Ruficoccus amylovorans]